MNKYLSLLLSLLTSAIFVIPVQAVPVAQTPKLPASEKRTASASTLTLQDLPSGFQELPPLSAPELDTIKQILGLQNSQFDNYFAFINPQSLEVVLGFSGILPNQPLTLLRFDAALQQLQQPNRIQNWIKELQEELQAVELGSNIVGYEALPDLNNIANASRGIAVVSKMPNIPPLRTEVLWFRRNQVVSITAVSYLDGTQPVISVKDVATKLDDRILQSSPAANSSRSTGIRY